MARGFNEDGPAYRVRHDQTWVDGRYPDSSYFYGPYASISAAKTMKSREERRSKDAEEYYWRTYNTPRGNKDTFTLEVAGEWKKV